MNKAITKQKQTFTLTWRMTTDERLHTRTWHRKPDVEKIFASYKPGVITEWLLFCVETVETIEVLATSANIGYIG